MSNLVDQAIQKAQAGYHQTACELLQQAVKEVPSDARAWYLLSQVIGDNAKAVDCLERALAIQPDNQQVKERLSSLHSELQHFEELPTPVQPIVMQSPAQDPLAKMAYFGLNLYIWGAVLTIFSVLLVIGFCYYIAFFYE